MASVQSTISYFLMKAGMFASREIEDVLGATGLTLRQFLLMSIVAEGAARSQQDISRAMHIDPTSVVALIDELEVRQLLVRQKSPQDRRRYVLSLTAKGSKVLRSATEKMRAGEDRFLADLSAGQRETLCGMLATVMQPKLDRL